MTMLANQKVRTHLQAKLMINGQDVGTARMQSMEADHDFGTEEVRGIGDYLQVEADHLRFSGRLSLDAFMLREVTLRDLGIAALGKKVLELDTIDLVVVDEAGTEIRKYVQCSIINYTETIRAGQICGERASCYFRDTV
jgi:hypothetical protein